MTTTTPERTGWLEISIQLDPVAHEALCAFLFDLGSEGVVSKDFQDRSLKAYLPFRKEWEDIQNRIRLFIHNLKDIFPEVQSPKLTFRKIEERDWSRNWRRFFRPDRITQKLMLLPAWEPVPHAINGHVIRIDPGPAFGTGQHPTTRMCLEALEKLGLPSPWTLLDVGTGSGILAVYGAKLGAARVVAIDRDPEAIRWAKRNIKLNDLAEAIELSCRPLEALKERFSVVVANLALGEILELIPHLSRVLHPNGWLILSGILREQVKDVEDALSEYGLYEDKRLYQEEWASVVARKIPPSPF